MDIAWKLAAIGYSAGSVRIGESFYSIDYRTGVIDLPKGMLPDIVEIESRIGKLADSEDSFLYLFCEINPQKENIELSARFEVLESKEKEIPDRQTGYGILAADTCYSDIIKGKVSDNRLCRHRNHLLAGRFRTSDGRNHGYGMRIVGGYTSPEAAEFEPVRKLDPTRIFKIREERDQILPGDYCCLKLCKTDDGFQAQIKKDVVNNGAGITAEKKEDYVDTLSFPGCDLLMQQDKERIFLGFAVAGKVRIRISDIEAEITEGKYSETPERAIRCVIPDYPFQRGLFDDEKAFPIGKGKRENAVIYASPEGTKEQEGSVDSPVDFETALLEAGEGSEIILLDGQYKLKSPVYLSSQSGGSFEKRLKIRAHHIRHAVLDGSDLPANAPLMILRGRFWILEGIIFRNSPMSGLYVCGSGNLVKNCEASHNGDTGILICAYPGEDKEKWPSYNHIEDCDSYDNCDSVMCNADGFGAKISIGKGNSFYRCIGHHNIDDGFDLYAKSIIGPTEPVLLEQCIAYENGKTLNDKQIRKNRSGGVGFKLGGEFQAVKHEVWNCVAFLNTQYGFTSNSNPCGTLNYCTSLLNGNKKLDDDYRFYVNDTLLQWKMQGLFPSFISEKGYKRNESILKRCKKALEKRIRSVQSSLKHYEKIIEKGIRPIRRINGEIEFGEITGWNRRFSGIGAVIDPDVKKKILMMIASLGGGGAERVTTILASEFSKKYPVHLLYMSRKKQKYDFDPNVHLIDCAWDSTFLEKHFNIVIRWPFKACTVLMTKWKYHPDVTVSMLHKPNLYNSLICLRDRRIMSERNDPSRKPAIEYQHAKSSYSRADHVVFQSMRVKGLFSKQIQDKSSIIRNPIRVSCFADKLPRNKIVTVGRYVPQKNHEMLIRAFALFYRTHPAYTLHLYGDGELREKLEALIKELHLENAVILEGFKENIHEQIKDARMFVLSSDYEGMSNALMEAMMMGLPCISTSCTGSDELIEDERNGLLVPVGDANALAEAMNRVADDSVLREKLIFNAQLCSMEFEKEQVVRAWERILFR